MRRFTASHRGGSGPPLVLLHGFTDTWRTWELVLPLDGEDVGIDLVLDAIERTMDEAGSATAP